MKKIKFRGKAKGGYFDGKNIYGYFAEKFNDNGELVPVIIWDTENPAYFSEVYPESVAQLIGYDKNGKEIYSDDKVDVDSEIAYWVYACWAEYEQIGDTFENWTLRESGENGVE